MTLKTLKNNKCIPAFKKNHTKLHYDLGRFGQTISGDLCEWGTFMEAINGYEPKRPTSYKEVITYLEQLRDSRKGKKIEVSHPIPSYQKGSKGCWDQCTHTINSAIDLVQSRQEQEKNNKLKLVGKNLNELNTSIIQFINKGGNSQIIEALKNLYNHLKADILADRCYKPGRYHWEDEQPEFNGPDLNKTYYPLIINHFVKLTKHLTLHPNHITQDEIKESEKSLETKLNANPVSTRLRTAISGVFGTILGLSIGAVIGGIISVGIGIIPGAIIGATIGGSSGSLFGLFHAKRHNDVINARKQKFQVIDDNGKRTAEPEKYARQALNHIEFSLKK